MIIGLYTSRIVLSSLGIEDYGLYNVVGGIVVVLSFLNGAMASSSQRYLNIELGKNNFDGLKNVLSSSIIIHTLAAIIIVLLSETIGLYFLNNFINVNPNRIEAAFWVYQFSILTFISTVLAIPFNALIIAHERMSAFAYISILEVLMKLFVAILIKYAPFDSLIFYSLLIFATTFISQIFYIFYCLKNFHECKGIKFVYKKELLRSMVSFSSWTIIGNLAFVAHTQGASIIINLFFGTAVNAAQGISNQVNSIVKGFVQNFMTALNPQIVKNYAQRNILELHSLILSGSRFAFYLVLIFTVPLILETPLLLSLWLKEVPQYTVVFIRLILLVTLFDSFNSLLNASIGATGRIKKYMIIQTSISIMHIPLSWMLFYLGFAPYFTNIVYLFLVVIMQVCRIKFVCRALNLSMKRFYKEVIMKCILVAFMSFAISYIIYYIFAQSIINMFIICILSILISSLIIIFIGITSSERIICINLLLKKLSVK